MTVSLTWPGNRPTTTHTGQQAGKEKEMRYTKKFAKEILDLWKNETNYFNGSMSEGQFETMLCCRGFSQAESITITMALILAGAKFAG